jgi:hypothetical protein
VYHNQPRYQQSVALLPPFGLNTGPVMQNLTVNIPHQLTRDEARRRIQEHVKQLRKQQGGMLSRLEDHWTGDRLDFTAAAMGMTIKGWAIVEESHVQLEVVLPWMLAVLAGPVMQRLEQQGRNLLSHRRSASS